MSVVTLKGKDAQRLSVLLTRHREISPKSTQDSYLIELSEGGNGLFPKGWLYLDAFKLEITYHCMGNLLVLYSSSIGGSCQVKIAKDRNTKNAEFLFYLFLDAKTCNALVGDLEERYKLIHKKFGARKANFWYWTQTITSIAPIIWAWMKKIVMKPVVAAITWAAAKHLLKDGSWLVMISAVLKRIRL